MCSWFSNYLFLCSEYPAQKFFESHLSLPHDIGKAVQVRVLNFRNYRHVEIYVNVDQTVDPNKPLCDLGDAHWHDLPEPFDSYK